jgi:HEAT repeat protein
MRIEAAQHLGRLRAVEGVEPLESLLDHDEPGVRLAAAGALANIGDASAVPSLVEALNDPDAAVRVSAIIGLGTCNDPTAIPHLLPFLREKSWLWARGQALLALLLIDNDEARRIAEEHLRKERWLRRRGLKRQAHKYRKRYPAHDGRDPDRLTH